MVVVRLARGGNRNRPFFYIVAADSRARRDGRFIEKLGFYNPIANENTESFRVNAERLEHWVSVGAQMSPAVKKLVKSNKKAA
jgi:small subunit ribosomal protein S16